MVAAAPTRAHPSSQIGALRRRIAALESMSGPAVRRLAFGDARIDGALGGGLMLGRWHEAAGEGLDLEGAAAAGAFVAALARPLATRGAAVWILRRDDLYGPGLAGLGFPAERLIQVRVRSESQALGALEESLATPGVSVAVAEVEAADLTAGRRLQLACEKTGATGFCLRRRPFGGPPPPRSGKAQQGASGTGSAAASRWRISPAPSQPPPGEPGLGPPRWRVELERARGGRPGVWLIEGIEEGGWLPDLDRRGGLSRQEQGDGAFPLRVVAELGDHLRAAPTSRRLAG